ncbi:lipid II:glycine glycyltransferase FemX [Afifella pfennigii]|uniref:lipid II:glycine glycyltransferase FemX n=1 Tax=Afifella pfennigii TaxID=209897 RepID=UPI00146F9C4A|nr:GNAT family N-acetyltransferase [Afifella pfennigii]
MPRPSPQTWNRLIADYEDASYEQSASCGEDSWGSRRLSHLVLRRQGMTLAAAQVVILRVGGRGLAYVKFGPMWRRRDEPAEPAIYRRMLAALVAEYCDRQGHLLTVLPRPHAQYTEAETRMLAEAGFAVRRKMVDPNRYLVDVSLGEDELRQSLAQKWRYNLKKAAANLQTHLCDDEEGRATFRRLHQEMVARKRHDDRDALHLVPRLMAEMPEALAPHTVLTWHEGRPVAGAVIAVLGDTAYYVFGASSEEALALKAGYALHWWIAGWLREQGVTWYDLGGEASDPGLKQFKKGMVGKGGAIVAIAEHDRWTRLGGRIASDLVFRFREMRRRIRLGGKANV